MCVQTCHVHNFITIFSTALHILKCTYIAGSFVNSITSQEADRVMRF